MQAVTVWAWGGGQTEGAEGVGYLAFRDGRQANHQTQAGPDDMTSRHLSTQP